MTTPSRVREEFSRQAETLSVAGAFTDADVLERVRAAVAPTKGMRILDLGCGPGIVAASLAPHAGNVVALDLTPEMLKKVRQRCEAAGLQNVRLALGAAEDLPFEDASFDAVVTRLTLHHLPDPRRALGEMVRVVGSRGRIVVADVVSSEDAEDAALHNALETLRDPSHERMLSSNELRSAVEARGLRVTATASWDMPREFEEWIRITNAPERRVPLRTIMRRLAQAEIRAGVDLRIAGDTVAFTHRWLLITAEKIG